MGCCSPSFRETVNEQEEKVNKRGNEKVPLLVKITILIITAGGLLAAYLL